MAAVPIKPAYGPTLGRLLSPRWRAAAPLARAALIALAALALALILAAALTLENAHFSQGGRVPFSFSYRDLYRVPAAGDYVELQRRTPGGRLEDSFAVRPLRLPPYSGSLLAELPLYAAGYIDALKQRYSDFVLRGDGKTKVNTLAGYDVFYTATVEGQRVYGRDLLLLPARRAARAGVAIVILASVASKPQISSPLEVASTGMLLRPLKTFSFG